MGSGFEALRPCVILLFEISLIYTVTDTRLSCLWVAMDGQSTTSPLPAKSTHVLWVWDLFCHILLSENSTNSLFSCTLPLFGPQRRKGWKRLSCLSTITTPKTTTTKKHERHRKTNKIKTVTHNRSANLNLLSERTHTSAARCGISQCYRLPASAPSSGWNKCQVFINLYLARERWLISNNASPRAQADGSCSVWARPSGQSWDSKSVSSIILSDSSV